MILPEENSKEIQEILSSDFTVIQKAWQIHTYYKSSIPYSRNTRQIDQEQPELSVMQIRLELAKRGDNLTPIDIDL